MVLQGNSKSPDNLFQCLLFYCVQLFIMYLRISTGPDSTENWPIKNKRQLGTATYTCNTRTWEAEGREFEFEASLGYIKKALSPK